MTKAQVKANGYDLSASRYRQLEQDEVFYEKPAVTLDRLRKLEAAAENEVAALETSLPAGRDALLFRPMSKTEIMAGILRLSPEERQEIMDQLAGLEELHVLRGGEPSAAEKALLDEALSEYRRAPQAGRPWRAVLADLRAGPSR